MRHIAYLTLPSGALERVDIVDRRADYQAKLKNSGQHRTRAHIDRVHRGREIKADLSLQASASPLPPTTAANWRPAPTRVDTPPPKAA